MSRLKRQLNRLSRAESARGAAAAARDERSRTGA
jgi:hypothetical protein